MYLSLTRKSVGAVSESFVYKIIDAHLLSCRAGSSQPFESPSLSELDFRMFCKSSEHVYLPYWQVRSFIRSSMFCNMVLWL